MLVHDDDGASPSTNNGSVIADIVTTYRVIGIKSELYHMHAITFIVSLSTLQ